ncbi:MAG: ABC transporter ATP-binding protein [Anaerolineaceae bacterium]
MKNPCLSIRAVKKNYEGIPLLDGISFDLHEKETMCLLGPSGSGKSTLLRIIAGLENADAGSVLWHGKDVSNLPVEKRNFGLMFQDYALFPHMSVAENIAFGPRMHGWKKEAIRERVAQTLQIVRMEKFANRSVVDLSGGEKQRVALARTIAPKPELLMLDEPLGALDKALRDELGQVLREILNELQIPTIYVTHDQEEAFTVGDNVAVLNFGKILQMGTPEEIYTTPASLWIASFLGFSNQVFAKVTSVNPLLVSTNLGEFSLPEKAILKLKKNDALVLVIRPEEIRTTPKKQGQNVISGVVKGSQFRGDGYRLIICMEDGTILRFRDTIRREIGQEIIFEISPSALLSYPAHE